MPISHKNKIIFIHIPKNAGTSIVESKELEFSTVGHQCFSHYKDRYPVQWENYTKACIVRNPWDRFVSCYEYARMTKSYWHSNEGYTSSEFGPHPDYKKVKNLCFEDFTRKFFNKELNLSHPCWAPQKNWVFSEEKLMVDEVFRLESIEGNKRFKEIFGVIEKLNQSKRSEYRSYYKTKESIDIIAEAYRDDIEFLNYSF
jgi:hypothetical protein